MLASPLAWLEDVAIGVINVPHTVVNRGTHAGEHLARGYLLGVERGEWPEAAAEGLDAVVDLSLAFLDLGSLGEAGSARKPTLAPEAPVRKSIVIEESGSALKVAPNQSAVPLPNPGESAMNYGTRVHQELPRIIRETNPGAGGRFNVAPGLTGPDLANPTRMNAAFAEMKSLWGRQSPMLRQSHNWGFEPDTGRYFFYDRQTGMVFEGIIQAEKYPSGVFRP